MTQSEMPFEVVSRSKSERIVKGNRQVIYKVTLKSTDGMHRLILSDKDSALIEKYPLDTIVAVKIGNSPQTTLHAT